MMHLLFGGVSGLGLVMRALLLLLLPLPRPILLLLDKSGRGAWFCRGIGVSLYGSSWRCLHSWQIRMVGLVGWRHWRPARPLVLPLVQPLLEILCCQEVRLNISCLVTRLNQGPLH